jgi:predicted alpha-1,6-mannanase (GH76 family)
MEKRKSTGRRHHAYVFYFLLLIASYQSFSQHSIYTPVADALQANTHRTFLSSDGRYYLHNNAGNTFFNYWWQAHGMDALLDAYLRTRNDVYKQRMKNLLLGTKDKNGGLYPTHYYYDMAWLAIASLRAYQNTNDAEYMTALQALWQDMKTGQHAGRGGALQWNKDAPHSFNACTNGPAIIFATRLYRINGNAQDLQTAKDIYTWMKGALIDPVNGAVWDSYNDSTNHTNKDWIFSYNVGTWIGAGLELYKVTGEQVYLDDAVKTAEYAMTNRLYNGVLWANETGDGDGGLFKGIFLRYLDQLAREGNIPPATRDRYINALKSTAQKVNTVAINKTNWLVNKDWNVTAETVTDYSTQLSGIMIMELASNFDKAFFFKDYNYGGYTAALVPGRYTKAQLNAMGILDNDISSLTVPKGYTVTVYVNDNFSGTSTTFTANTSYVGASWNDTISSLVISAAATPLHK